MQTRVLLLIRDRDLEILLRDYLPHAGFQIAPARTRDEAANVAQKGLADVVLAECERCGELAPILGESSVPVVTLSDFGRPESCLDGRCSRVLTKPASLRTICEALAGLAQPQPHP